MRVCEGKNCFSIACLLVAAARAAATSLLLRRSTTAAGGGIDDNFEPAIAVAWDWPYTWADDASYCTTAPAPATAEARTGSVPDHVVVSADAVAGEWRYIRLERIYIAAVAIAQIQNYVW